jgi:MerR family transcriptional regulator, copper efflux regulator
MPAMTNATNRHPGSLMTIGEASRRSGFTVKALRFYERCGVLPTSNRRPNGYRIYYEMHLGRLSFIRDAKALGLTLGEIGQIVRVSNGNMRRQLLQVLDDRITEATQRIGVLTRLRGELERRRRTVARGRRSAGEGAYCTCLKKTGRTA